MILKNQKILPRNSFPLLSVEEIIIGLENMGIVDVETEKVFGVMSNIYFSNDTFSGDINIPFKFLKEKFKEEIETIAFENVRAELYETGEIFLYARIILNKIK